jgi:hypothetical protein
VTTYFAYPIRAASVPVMSRRALLVGAAVLVVVTWMGPAGAVAHSVSACKFVTLKDARTLLGPNASGSGRSTDPACLYTAPPKGDPIGSQSSLLVQVWSTAKPRSIPGARTTVDGVAAWYFNPPSATGPNAVRSIGTLTSYRKGQLFKVAAAGTEDDLSTAKAALHAAFKRQ